MPEQAAVTRCKVRVQSVTRNMNADGSVESENVTLSAVYSSDPNNENAQWSKWTPCANFQLTINNPGAIGTLSKGHEYFVDFIPAPAVAK
jgi:hypothetical protein